VDLAWKGGRLATATIRSTKGESPVVRYGQRKMHLNLTAGQSATLDADLAVH
jgi:hypothetical protein